MKGLVVLMGMLLPLILIFLVANSPVLAKLIGYVLAALAAFLILTNGALNTTGDDAGETCYSNRGAYDC